jgi:opacity protein-like surface antigen
MNWISTVVRCLGVSIVVVAYVATSNVSRSYAETYIAGQFGVTLPSVAGKSLGEGDLTGQLIIPGSRVSAQSLDESILYGGKIGHYFKAVPWLGLEAEVYNTTPHIKQQMTTFSGPSGPVGSVELPGVNFRVLTIAPLNLMFRYPGTRLQPYIGVGPGIFMARIHDPSITQGESSQSSTKFGLNALIGLRYYFTRHVSAFAEGKFNYVRFSFEENPNFFGFDTRYSPIHGAFGLSVHF